MLDFSLAPRLQFASTQKMIYSNCFLPRFWLVLVGYLDVQSMHTPRKGAYPPAKKQFWLGSAP